MFKFPTLYRFFLPAIKVIKRRRFWKKFSETNFYLRIRNPKEYERQQQEPKFYKKLLQGSKGDNLIFDVGANLGYKSVIFLDIVKNVVAFEPSSRLCDYLENRFKTRNLIVYNCALGSHPHFTHFYVVEDNEAYNSLNKKHIETTAYKRGIATINTVKPKPIKVEVLENFIKTLGIPKYIKIDVEGYELEVLKGLKTAVSVISFEANLPDFRDETVLAVKYLDELSSGKYKYNFTATLEFLNDRFVSAQDAIIFIESTTLSYLEIYAKIP